MRKLFLASCVALLLFGAPHGALAQTTNARAQAAIAAILAQYAEDGSGLSNALAIAVEGDPSLAAAAVAAAGGASAAQQRAIGFGLATAATYFANLAAAGGTGADTAAAALQQIADAMTSAPGLTQTAFAQAGGSLPTSTALGGGTGMTTNANVGRCVSPSAPGVGGQPPGLDRRC